MSAEHPSLEAIGAATGVPAQTLQRLTEGTNVVFAAGEVIVKLYRPRWVALARRERAVLQRISGQLPVATPRVLSVGEIDGWPFVVMNRLPGRELHEVWPQL